MNLSLFDPVDIQIITRPDPVLPVDLDEEAMIPERRNLKLWDHQRELKRLILREWARGIRSTYIVAATGAGKTVLFSSIVQQAVSQGKKVLILAHRDELIRQPVKALGQLGIPALVEKSTERALGSFCDELPVVIASIQTMRGDRLLQWPRDSFDVIVIDEAHHATSNSFKNIMAYFTARFILGVTATPDRSDGVSLKTVFQTQAGDDLFKNAVDQGKRVAHPGEYTTEQAIRDGTLVPLEIVHCDTGIDLRGIRLTSSGELDREEFDRVVQEQVGTLASIVKREIEQRPTFLFLPDIGSAYHMSLALQDVGVTAEHIASVMPSSEGGVTALTNEQRIDIMDRHRKGDFQVVCNAMLLTEGTDAPYVSCIGLLRPTKSRSLYVQMVGRGLRRPDNNPLSKGKTVCRLLDFTFNSGTHSFVHPVDLLDNYDVDYTVIERAKSLVDSGSVPNPIDAVEIAQLQIKEENAMRERVRIKEKDVEYMRVQYNPFEAAMQSLGMKPIRESEYWVANNPASDKQVNALKKFGWTIPPQGLSKGAAGKILDVEFKRREMGLCTRPQMDYAIGLKCPPERARGMTYEEAGQWITDNKPKS